MIELEDVVVQYADSTPLRLLRAGFGAGSHAITGPSGSGKSTLLRVMGGFQKPTSGMVRIDGSQVRTASWTASSDDRVALIHQDYRLVPFLSVAENLMLAAELRGSRLQRVDVDQALERVALDPGMAGRAPTTLSGGEQQRVAIARALMARARVLLADEPTGALDAANSRRVADVFVDLGRDTDLTVIVATHDPAVADCMDHTYTMHDGTLDLVPVAPR